MNDFLEIKQILNAFTPGAVGVWTGVLMFSIYLLREWRENRKLSFEDRIARRDGYAKQVEMLMRENRSLMTDLSTFRRELDENRERCDAENQHLHSLIDILRTEVSDLRSKALKDELEIAKLKLVGGTTVRLV